MRAEHEPHFKPIAYARIAAEDKRRAICYLHGMGVKAVWRSAKNGSLVLCDQCFQRLLGEGKVVRA